MLALRKRYPKGSSVRGIIKKSSNGKYHLYLSDGTESSEIRTLEIYQAEKDGEMLDYTLITTQCSRYFIRSCNLKIRY